MIFVCRYEAAGDQYVGRTVPGLPLESSSFSVLPPMFVHRDNIVEEAIRMCFPQLLHTMREIAEFCLASVVYHKDYLIKTLPKHHLLFSSPLFRDRRLLKDLNGKVECRLPTPTCDIRSTGLLFYVFNIMISDLYFNYVM